MRKPCSLRRVLTESLVNGSGVAHRDRAEHASRPIMGRSGSSHHYSPGYWSCSHWRLGLRHPERCQRPRPSPTGCRYQSQPCGTDRRAHDRWTKLPFGTASAGRRTRCESHSLAGCPATRAARPTAVRSGLSVPPPSPPRLEAVARYPCTDRGRLSAGAPQPRRCPHLSARVQPVPRL